MVITYIYSHDIDDSSGNYNTFEDSYNRNRLISGNFIFGRYREKAMVGERHSLASEEHSGNRRRYDLLEHL